MMAGYGYGFVGSDGHVRVGIDELDSHVSIGTTAQAGGYTYRVVRVDFFSWHKRPLFNVRHVGGAMGCNCI